MILLKLKYIHCFENRAIVIGYRLLKIPDVFTLFFVCRSPRLGDATNY